MQDARAVANFVLENFDSSENNLTNMKMNKIIYFLHGWYYLRKDIPLIKNHIEAWKHGPVIRVVFDAFKKYSDSPIRKPATFLSYSSDRDEVVSFSNCTEIDKDFLLRIIRHYIKYSALDLRNLTHAAGSPWHQVFYSQDSERGIRNRIPNEIILKHFCLLAESRRTH